YAGIRCRNVTGVQTCALPIFRTRVPHVRPVDNVQHAFLASADDEIRVGDEQGVLDSEIFISGVEERPVVGREPVEQRAGGTDLRSAERAVGSGGRRWWYGAGW